jgi:rhodanese-related sulfurtransferase
MNRLLLAAFISSSFVSISFAAGAKAPAALTKKKEGFTLIHAADLKKAMDSREEPVTIFDANNDKTRQQEGVIPGATPLTSVTQYEAKGTLPADKNAKLVFYCANTMCTASHSAAKVAVAAGYKNVSVMVDGIQGWKKAGNPTEKYH